jgi:hypothetical protein
MRYVTALFDAPYPALAAVAMLREHDVAPTDLVVLPTPPHPAPSADWAPGPGDHPLAWLQSLGVSDRAAALCAAGVTRGAILLVVRCPTLSVGLVVDTLEGGAPLDLAAVAARWAADPSFRYPPVCWPGEASGTPGSGASLEGQPVP